MTSVERLRYLRIALVVAGLASLALYPLMLVWPSGWAWQAGRSDYQMMLVGLYATLGVFLLLAARNPLSYLSLIWFTVWSSLVHGGVMAVQVVADPGQRSHLLGDVPAVFLVAIVLAALTPRGEEARAARHTVA